MGYEYNLKQSSEELPNTERMDKTMDTSTYVKNYNTYMTRLRDLREDRDYSQAQIAAVINCSQVCYSNYEIGRRELPVRTLILLAEFYDVSADYILGLTNKKNYRYVPCSSRKSKGESHIVEY